MRSQSKNSSCSSCALVAVKFPTQPQFAAATAALLLLLCCTTIADAAAAVCPFPIPGSREETRDNKRPRKRGGEAGGQRTRGGGFGVT